MSARVDGQAWQGVVNGKGSSGDNVVFIVGCPVDGQASSGQIGAAWRIRASVKCHGQAGRASLPADTLGCLQGLAGTVGRGQRYSEGRGVVGW